MDTDSAVARPGCDNTAKFPVGKGTQITWRFGGKLARVVVGPSGELYASTSRAARDAGISRQAMGKRCTRRWLGWRYATAQEVEAHKAGKTATTTGAE
jgi:hypothetical protein